MAFDRYATTSLRDQTTWRCVWAGCLRSRPYQARVLLRSAYSKADKISENHSCFNRGSTGILLPRTQELRKHHGLADVCGGRRTGGLRVVMKLKMLNNSGRLGPTKGV
jgi:hypothetical protein